MLPLRAMKGSVRRRGDRWLVTVDLGRDEYGRRVRKFATAADASAGRITFRVASRTSAGFGTHLRIGEGQPIALYGYLVR